MEELKRIIDDSEIMQEDDSSWPQPDRVGRQELEIVIGDEHISFTTSKIGSLVDVNGSRWVCVCVCVCVCYVMSVCVFVMVYIYFFFSKKKIFFCCLLLLSFL